MLWPLTFFMEVTGKIMAGLGLHNVWLYNLYLAVFYPAIIFMYRDVFSGNIIKFLIKIAAVFYVTWSVCYLILYNISTINTYNLLAASGFVIFLALLYLIKLFLDKETTTPLRNDYYYWFSIGFLLYFGFNGIMLGMYTKIITSKAYWLPYFIFYANHLITFVLHICLWAGFIAARKWMK